MARRMFKLVPVTFIISVVVIGIFLYNGVSVHRQSRIQNGKVHRYYRPTLAISNPGHTEPTPQELSSFVMRNDVDGLDDMHSVTVTDDTRDQTTAVALFTSTQETNRTPEQDHMERRRHLREICSDRKLMRNATYRTVSPVKGFYLSKEYDFAYCKVPKSASTFWMQLFLILENRRDPSRYIFNVSRNVIHLRTNRLKVSPAAIFKKRTRLVLVARNPFSRLYSAYIDKVYMPLFWEQLPNIPSVRRGKPFNETVSKSIGGKVRQIESKRTPVCANNVTFEDFLKFVINEAKKRRTLEPHWAPISSLCRPCLMNTHIIIRQESFARDVEFALNNLEIDPAKYSVLTKAMNDHRAGSSIPGVIGVVTSKVKSNMICSCISALNVMQRIWNATKIQGFLEDTVRFPFEHFQNIDRDTIPQKAFTQLLLETIRSQPVTQERRIAQRSSYLVQAYKNIPKDVIRQIQDIYMLDFRLFNYSNEPPSAL